MQPDYIPTPASVEYLERLPGAVPAGRVLVHNQVYPAARRPSVRGSRAWLQAPDAALEICGCGWAPELGAHYRNAAIAFAQLAKVEGELARVRGDRSITETRRQAAISTLKRMRAVLVT